MAICITLILYWCKEDKGSQLDSFKGLFISDNLLKNIQFWKKKKGFDHSVLVFWNIEKCNLLARNRYTLKLDTLC